MFSVALTYSNVLELMKNMGFAFRLEDFSRYLKRVEGATYLDVTRRTDPARIQQVWDNLRVVVETFGAPWIVQLWTKDAVRALHRTFEPETAE